MQYTRLHAEQRVLLRQHLMNVKKLFAKQSLPYHNVQHTKKVLDALYLLLRAEKSCSSQEMFLGLVAAAYHDIGYVNGLFLEDDMTLHPAMLRQVHVNRSLRYVQEQLVDGEFLAKIIAYTNEENLDLKGFLLGEMLRAADYVALFLDEDITSSHKALFEEFSHNGLNEKMQYHTPEDITKRFPIFYEQRIAPLIHPFLSHLEKTKQGKQVLQRMLLLERKAI
jgi:hypothetical protein